MDTDLISISLKNVNKTFKVTNTDGRILNRLYNIIRGNKQEIRALSDISFDIKKGEIFGIIGRNGSGKSTLLKIIIGCIQADKESEVNVEGSIMRLTLGMGMDPNLTARDNIYLNGTILGLTFKKIGEIFDEVINFAELKEFIDVPVKFYSKGMLSRLKFSIALHAQTDVLLIDEFFGGVGDLAFRKKSTELFKSTMLEGRTVVLVSHSMRTIFRNCDRVLLLNEGKIIDINTPKKIIDQYTALFKDDKDEALPGTISAKPKFIEAPEFGGGVAKNFGMDVASTKALLEIKSNYAIKMADTISPDGSIDKIKAKEIMKARNEEIKKLIGSAHIKKYLQYEKWWAESS